MYRTKTCGELNIKNIGEEVELAGWIQKIRNLGGMIFIDLRDEFGIIQITVNEENCWVIEGVDTTIDASDSLFELSLKNIKLTDEIRNSIMKCNKLVEVEDIYRPYKEKKKTKATEAIKNGLEPLAKIIAEEEKEHLLVFIETLEYPEKEILIRRYYYEQKPKEIAIALDIPKKQVENCLYQTKQKLKKKIEQ